MLPADISVTEIMGSRRQAGPASAHRARVVRGLRPPRMAPLRYAWIRRLVRFGVSRVHGTGTPGVTVTDHARPGLRVHVPATRHSDGALLWIHGGGLVIGSPVVDDRLCGAVARDLGVVVVAVSYRPAPEHPFPAALDDCHYAWLWLQDNASVLGIAPGRVAVGGVSAGGGLAAALTQRLHDDDGGGHRAVPVAQWLLCPMLDDRTAARHDLDAVRHLVWSNRLNRFAWRAYLGDRTPPPPYSVPARRTDLRGLPPAWIGVGDIDLFHDEDRDYATRLRAAGVDTTFHVVPGAPHGFESWAAEAAVSREYLATAQSWLRRVLAGD